MFITFSFILLIFVNAFLRQDLSLLDIRLHKVPPPEKVQMLVANLKKIKFPLSILKYVCLILEYLYVALPKPNCLCNI